MEARIIFIIERTRTQNHGLRKNAGIFLQRLGWERMSHGLHGRRRGIITQRQRGILRDLGTSRIPIRRVQTETRRGGYFPNQQFRNRYTKVLKTSEGACQRHNENLIATFQEIKLEYNDANSG